MSSNSNDSIVGQANPANGVSGGARTFNPPPGFFNSQLSSVQPQQQAQEQNAVVNPVSVQQQQQQNSVVGASFGEAFARPARNVAANPDLTLGKMKPAGEPRIRDVWRKNLRQEFATIRKCVSEGFDHVALDTEFPGAPLKPKGEFVSYEEHAFMTMQVNCNVLKVIQIGITLFDKKGNVPKGVSTWQFNFKFSLASDMWAQDSIDLLQMAGIPFSRLESDGIDHFEFAEYLLTSNLILNDDVTWISFHSGYDLGYMFCILRDSNIPEKIEDFFELLQLYFPVLYDVKFLMKDANLPGGLADLANSLGVDRIGQSHQSGSDSLLTGHVFFKIRELFFKNSIDNDVYNGRVYGLAGEYHSVDTEELTTSQTTN